MLDRLDTWLIMGIFLWLVLGGVAAWASSMKKRLAAAEKKVVNLRLALNSKTAELHQVKANVEAIKNLATMDKTEAIEVLQEKLKASEHERRHLEVLLNQKWKTANGGES